MTSEKVVERKENVKGEIGKTKELKMDREATQVTEKSREVRKAEEKG